MKTTLIVVGKIQNDFIAEGISIYEKRLKHYTRFEKIILNNKKKNESEMILKQIKANDFVVLLDERGTEFSSMEFSNFIQQKMNHSVSNLIFVIGGAFGFSNILYQRANFQLSLSKMTLPHELAQLIFMEQLYRAFTILKNEKYHHE